MKIYLKLVLIFAISQSSLAWACEKTSLSYQGKTVELCFTKKTESYLSKNCDSVAKCFFKKKLKLQFYPNQSPGFSLCYQLGGDAFFGEVKGVEDKVPFCKMGDYFADQESLLLHYRSSN